MTLRSGSGDSAEDVRKRMEAWKAVVDKRHNNTIQQRQISS